MASLHRSRLVALVVLMALSQNAGAAEAYPVKPVRVIVPYGTGGGADAMARLIAPKFSEYLGQSVIIDNRGGAGGNIGSEQATKAPPDGYTLLVGAAALAINVSLYSRLTFDPVKDLTPVSLLASSPNIVVVHPSLPAHNMKELIALAKARPGQINYASGGSGTTPHLATELLKTMANINLVHVPYKSAGPAVVALLSGEVPLSLLPGLTVLNQVKAGRLRALAITSLKRAPALPQLPTVAESGLPGFEASQWYGILAPAATPDAVITRLNAELVKVMRQPEIVERIVNEASIPMGTTPEEFASWLKAEIAKWSKVVKISGAKVE